MPKSPFVLIALLLVACSDNPVDPEPPMCTPALIEAEEACRELTGEELQCLLDLECDLPGWPEAGTDSDVGA